MFDLWCSWQAEVSNEINLENQMEELRKKKQDHKCEIAHLNYLSSYLYGLYSQAQLALSKARYNYEKTDYKLACVDGRLSVCEEVAYEMRVNANVRDIISTLSSEERARLINELGELED